LGRGLLFLKGGAMAVLGLVFLLALMVESIVEYFIGPVFDKTARLQPYKWCLMYIAAGVGILGCFFYRFDMIYFLGYYLAVGDAAFAGPSWLGMLLTGLTVGRGSNAVHDLIMKFFVR
jgi:hypothetical protein